MGTEISLVPRLGVIPRWGGEGVGIITVEATQLYTESMSRAPGKEWQQPPSNIFAAWERVAIAAVIACSKSINVMRLQTE